MEYIGQFANEAWHCLCGNTASAAGFFPCDRQGNPVEPTPKEWTTDCYVCDQCGRIIQQVNRQVVGQRVPSAPFQCVGCGGTEVLEVSTDARIEDLYTWKAGKYYQTHHDTKDLGDHYFQCAGCEQRLTEDEQNCVLKQL